MSPGNRYQREPGALSAGGSDATGEAHLDAFVRLADALTTTADPAPQTALRDQMIAHVDAAIDAFADAPAKRARTLLVRAGLLANLAQSDPSRRLDWVSGALEGCIGSLDALRHSGDLSYATVSDWHAYATAILLVLHELIEEPEPRAALQAIIGGYSTILGVALGEELKTYEQGRTRLVMAEILEGLIDQEGDPTARRWMRHDRRELARDALQHLASTSRPHLAYEAWVLAQDADPGKGLSPCPACGYHNRPDSRFCGGCGRTLAGVSPPQAATTVCPECGATNPVGHHFCTKCGAHL